MIEIKVYGTSKYSLDRAIRRFEDARIKTALISDIRKHSQYEKPSTRRRKKHLKAILRKGKNKKSKKGG